MGMPWKRALVPGAICYVLLALIYSFFEFPERLRPESSSLLSYFFLSLLHFPLPKFFPPFSLARSYAPSFAIYQRLHRSSWNPRENQLLCTLLPFLLLYLPATPHPDLEV